MKLYLDNCCFNRPYDNQEDIKIQIETQAKLLIQTKIKENQYSLVWSYILELENKHNPYFERKIEISKWRSFAIENIQENHYIIERMNQFILLGLKPLDALHVSCANESNCQYFITVDRGILKKKHLITSIKIVNPIEFIYEIGGDQ